MSDRKGDRQKYKIVSYLDTQKNYVKTFLKLTFQNLVCIGRKIEAFISPPILSIYLKSHLHKPFELYIYLVN
jgi:hypothetical protein